MTEDYLKCQMEGFTLGGARMNELRGKERGNLPYFRKPSILGLTITPVTPFTSKLIGFPDMYFSVRMRNGHQRDLFLQGDISRNASLYPHRRDSQSAAAFRPSLPPPTNRRICFGRSH